MTTNCLSRKGRDPEKPNKNSKTRQYWAFRRGRPIAQLPRRIEQAFFMTVTH